MMTSQNSISLQEEVRLILDLAVTLADLQAQDFAVLRSLAEVCLPWAEEVGAEIRAILEANETTRQYADTYLNGDPAGWYRSLFQMTNEEEFWLQEMLVAVEHVQKDVPNEVIVGLASQWINRLARRAQEQLTPEQALAFTRSMPRIFSGTVTVMVATSEMVTMRTFMEETGFSRTLIKRLRQHTLQTFADQLRAALQENG